MPPTAVLGRQAPPLSLACSHPPHCTGSLQSPWLRTLHGLPTTSSYLRPCCHLPGTAPSPACPLTCPFPPHLCLVDSDPGETSGALWELTHSRKLPGESNRPRGVQVCKETLPSAGHMQGTSWPRGVTQGHPRFTNGKTEAGARLSTPAPPVGFVQYTRGLAGISISLGVG